MSRYLHLYISFLFAVFVVLPFPALASWQPEITIGIMQGASSVQFSATGGTLYVYENPEKHPVFVLPQRKEICETRRMRCASPPESVSALRSRLR